MTSTQSPDSLHSSVLSLYEILGQNKHLAVYVLQVRVANSGRRWCRAFTVAWGEIVEITTRVADACGLKMAKDGTFYFNPGMASEIAVADKLSELYGREVLGRRL